MSLHLRQTADRLDKRRLERLHIDAGAGQQRCGRPVFLLQQGQQQVRRFDDLVVVPDGQALGIGQSLLELGGQFVQTHGLSSARVALMLPIMGTTGGNSTIGPARFPVSRRNGTSYATPHPVISCRGSTLKRHAILFPLWLTLVATAEMTAAVAASAAQRACRSGRRQSRQRSAACSSARRASTQRAPAAVTSRFQKGARVFR
ncbi:MAG: hypothetical protein AW09_000380 [Candidatus Accumulibacter phosphatis]|uniref:Uncharacterized protein n=1 Tax=Candidatus Accumulibacter phosphatis TaxID=327160 RepID=A0A080LZK0_9PROT|nr:MAG: hypothetical protein AW09_000380 [Candidatus Accumulibacter phosphatis]